MNQPILQTSVTQTAEHPAWLPASEDLAAPVEGQVADRGAEDPWYPEVAAWIAGAEAAARELPEEVD
ncbi:hypothetical protein AB0M95_39060, partial [Sphaerisporangium sp. NPDC051017]|uniref:hypothetical protein n=1 Tax=Sphaerisporangium sp. NPDC051017 TaxID=3154636 RepID=UPI00343054EA